MLYIFIYYFIHIYFVITCISFHTHLLCYYMYFISYTFTLLLFHFIHIYLWITAIFLFHFKHFFSISYTLFIIEANVWDKSIAVSLTAIYRSCFFFLLCVCVFVLFFSTQTQSRLLWLQYNSGFVGHWHVTIQGVDSSCKLWVIGSDYTGCGYFWLLVMTIHGEDVYTVCEHNLWVTSNDYPGGRYIMCALTW